MPTSEAYHLLHTASMVGLFSCIFIKASQRSRVRSLNVAEIKRGLGGLHGNKVSRVSKDLVNRVVSLTSLIGCYHDSIHTRR